MHHVQRRLSPALIIAIAAFFVALAGTAAAAAIITSPDQLASGVVQGRHVQDEAIPNSKLIAPQLKLRVSADGKVAPDGDGTAKKVPLAGSGVGTGVYDVTFDAQPLNGITGNDTILNENCAINATVRSTPGPGIPILAVSKPQFVGDNTVRVTSVRQEVAGDGQLSAKVTDTAFDITASC
jgi:hypothetical protein